MNRRTFLCGAGKFLGTAVLAAKAPFIFDMGRGLWKDPYAGEIIKIGYSGVIHTVQWEWRQAVEPVVIHGSCRSLPSFVMYDD